MNNFDLDDDYQLQVFATIFENCTFIIDKLKFYRGKANKSNIQELHEAVNFGVYAVGAVTDAGNEQLVRLPRQFFRFICSIHTTFNAQSYLLKRREAFFSFNGGRELMVIPSYLHLKRLHAELLNPFQVIFRRASNLERTWIQFVFCVRENLFLRLFYLCEVRMRAMDEDFNDWEAIYQYLRLMLILQLLYKSTFIEMPNVERINILCSCVIRLEKFKFWNENLHILSRIKSSLRFAITMLLAHPPARGTDVLLKTTLAILEGLKWRMDKDGITTVASAREFFNFLSRGVFFHNFESPYAFFERLTCLPSIALIEDIV